MRVEPVRVGVDAGDQTLSMVLIGTATQAAAAVAESSPPEEISEQVAVVQPPQPVATPTPLPQPISEITPEPIAAATPVPTPQATPAPARQTAAPQRVAASTRVASAAAKVPSRAPKGPAAAPSAGGSGGGILMRMGAEGAPNYLRNPAPEYPRQARIAGQEGVVILHVTVDPAGAPACVTVSKSSGFAALDDSASTTVRRRWRFRPANQSGVPIVASVLVPVRFSLKEYSRLTVR